MAKLPTRLSTSKRMETFAIYNFHRFECFRIVCGSGRNICNHQIFFFILGWPRNTFKRITELNCRVKALQSHQNRFQASREFVGNLQVEVDIISKLFHTFHHRHTINSDVKLQDEKFSQVMITNLKIMAKWFEAFTYIYEMSA